MHKFENLQKEIENCNLPTERKDRASFQHLSVRQKLFSVESYKEELLSFESAKFIDAASQSSTTSSGIPTHLPQQLPVGLQLHFQLNRIIDGFVTNAKSVFDTLARELQWLYEGPPQGDIYFSQWPPSRLPKRYSASLLWGKIDAVKQENWYTYLDVLRSSTIHESLISTRINLQFDPINNTVPISHIYLPDDPKVWPMTYTRQSDLKKFTQETHQNIIGFLEEIATIIKSDLPSIS